MSLAGRDRQPAAKPLWRGVSHQYAALAAVLGAVVLIVGAPGARAQVAAAAYGAPLVGLFAVSALYHRRTWAPAMRRRLRGLDHALIFLMVAGTYTPVAVLALPGPVATTMLLVVWCAALAGAGWKLLAPGGPKWTTAVAGVVLGWLGLAALPTLLTSLAPTALVLFALGGAFYTAGACVYALRRPDPLPTVFGYHEVFHLLVVAAAGAHFSAIALYVLPRG